MTVSETQVEAFVAALPYSDFHDAESVRAAIAAAHRGEGLSAATAALLNGHEPNWLPGVEAMVGGALYRALEARAPIDASMVSEAQVDAFIKAVWTPVDEQRARLLGREAIAAAERWGDDGVRVAAGITLDGHEVSNMPGHEIAVARALNEARRDEQPRLRYGVPNAGQRVARGRARPARRG